MRPGKAAGQGLLPCSQLNLRMPHLARVLRPQPHQACRETLHPGSLRGIRVLTRNFWPTAESASRRAKADSVLGPGRKAQKQHFNMDVTASKRPELALPQRLTCGDGDEGERHGGVKRRHNGAGAGGARVRPGTRETSKHQLPIRPSSTPNQELLIRF